MSYIYEQRKHPFAKDKTPSPANTAVHGPEAAPPVPAAAGPAGAQTGLDLDAAMKARIQHTFGDLSAVKNYTPPAREQAPSQSAPYTGSVTHTLSDASPSPSVAGPMQAKRRDADAEGVKAMEAGGKAFNGRYATRGYAKYDDLAPEEWKEKVHTPNWFSKKFLGKRNQIYKVRRGGLPVEPSPLEIEGLDQISDDDDDLLDLRPRDLITDLGDEGRKRAPRKKNRKPDRIKNDLILNEPPRSQFADDFDLLNSQQGSDEERRNAYDRIALPIAERMTEDQQHAVSEYIQGSSGPNAYLREQKDHLYYPQTEENIQRIKKQTEDISQVIQNNPLPEQLTTYRGTTDKFFAALLQQNGLGKAVKEDGSVDHQWLKQNQKKLRKNLVGKTFHEKAFTSTSTEKKFALNWSRMTSFNEKNFEYGMTGQIKKALKLQNLYDTHPEQINGAHLLTMNLPKGSKGTFVDRATDSIGRTNNQREVLLDKGSFFKISDIRKMEDSDSYELVMDLLTEEKGKKKKK